jgi:hypothetical protein
MSLGTSHRALLRQCYSSNSLQNPIQGAMWA